MSLLFRRLRAAAVLGVLWGVAGAIVGGAIELVLNILPGPDLWLGVDLWPAALAIPAFFAGVAFSAVLWAVEGRRKFDELVLPRIAVVGAIGGVALGILVGLPVAGVAVLAAMSSGLASGTLALARRGDAPEIAAGGSSRSLPRD